MSSLKLFRSANEQVGSEIIISDDEGDIEELAPIYRGHYLRDLYFVKRSCFLLFGSLKSFL